MQIKCLNCPRTYEGTGSEAVAKRKLALRCNKESQAIIPNCNLVRERPKEKHGKSSKSGSDR
jgi:hypothetical protein